MIIVSQDKYNVLNFDTIVNIGVEEISILNDMVEISAQTNGNTIVLGKYKDEERAKEVLQEITIAYANITMMSMSKIKIHEFIPAQEIIRNIVYQMPKE